MRTNQLLATGGKRPLYRDVDGALCARQQRREKDPDKGKVSAQVKQESETAYAVNVTVDLWGGPQRGHRCGMLCLPLPVGGGPVGLHRVPAGLLKGWMNRCGGGSPYRPSAAARRSLGRLFASRDKKEQEIFPFKSVYTCRKFCKKLIRLVKRLTIAC